MTYIMQTKRLYLRYFSKKDYKDLFEYLSSEENVYFEPYNALTAQECRDEAKSRENNPDYFACVLKDSGKMIGNIYFHRTEPARFMTWELGYIFNPRYHRLGFATEASARVLQYGFETLKARRIVANCDVLNIPSHRIMEKLGMRREKHALKEIYFKSDAFGNPIWKDTYQYAILADEFFENV